MEASKSKSNLFDTSQQKEAFINETNDLMIYLQNQSLDFIIENAQQESVVSPKFAGQTLQNEQKIKQ